jgi:hypothetical protein
MARRPTNGNRTVKVEDHPERLVRPHRVPQPQRAVGAQVFVERVDVDAQDAASWQELDESLAVVGARVLLAALEEAVEPLLARVVRLGAGLRGVGVARRGLGARGGGAAAAMLLLLLRSPAPPDGGAAGAVLGPQSAAV